MRFKPPGDRVLIVAADDARRKFFQFGRGVSDGISFVRDLKHGQIVHFVPEADQTVAAEQRHQLFCRRRLGHPLRQDLQPGRVRIDVARKDAAESALQRFIDGGKLFFGVADAGKIVHVAVQRFLGG